MHLQGYIKLAIGFISIISVLHIPILFILKKKGIGVIRQLSYVGLVFSAFFIVFVTLILFNIPFNFMPEEYVLNIVPFGRFVEEEIDIFKTITAEIIPNIIIFIPLGIFIPTVFKKTRKLYKMALIVFLMTFSIEFFQYFIGRSSDIDDLIANLLGGIIGFGVFKVFNYLLKNIKLWNKFIGDRIV